MAACWRAADGSWTWSVAARPSSWRGRDSPFAATPWGVDLSATGRILQGRAPDEPPDYLLLTTKVIAGEDRAALIRPAVGPRTVIVAMENGIGIEAPLAAAFPDHELISALAFVCVSRAAPGHIHHQAYGALTLGRYPLGASPASERLADAFRQAGIAAELDADIVTARWRKAVWNAAFNPASVLAGGVDTARLMADEHALRMIGRAMDEVCWIRPPPAIHCPSGPPGDARERDACRLISPA